MSSSRGRIIIGNTGLVMDEVEFSKSNMELDVWDEDAEKRFLERVKLKALSEAKKIIKKAKEEAENIKQEAENRASEVYEEAYNKGYEEGLKKSREEIDKLKEEIKNRLVIILNNLDSEKNKLIDSIKEDVVNLILISIEKIAGSIFSNNKQHLLKELIFSCLNEIKESKKVKIRVSKEDVELLRDIVRMAKDVYPDIKDWDVLMDDNLKQGDVVVDTGVMKVEDSFEKRRDMILNILKDVSV